MEISLASLRLLQYDYAMIYDSHSSEKGATEAGVPRGILCLA